MSDIAANRRTLVALDTTDIDAAARLAERLNGHVGGFKVGKEFFTACGPDGVRRIAAMGQPVFLDLKFHDIPNTVAGAVRAALPLKPFIVNVHACGGADMMKAAAEGPLAGVIDYNTRPLVSIDFNHNPHSSCFDATLTRVMEGNLVKVLSWYDNEWGFSNRMLDTATALMNA